MRNFLVQIMIVLGIAAILAIPVFAADADAAIVPPPNTGAVEGVLIDAQSGEPVSYAQMYLPELNRTYTSHDDGSFHFYELPTGTFMLKIFRVGYRDANFKIVILENDTTFVRLQLSGAAIAVEDVIIEESRDELSELATPEQEISGKKLRQNLGRTIAETVDYEPGISQRTMGPAPARPVLRGLGGDRLLVLEDGERTGDLSGTSSDHAVTIEPMTAERVEIIRGPEALLHGSNVLAGVINVARGYIPTTKIHRVSGSLSAQGESVNDGYSVGGSASVPAGAFVVRGDGSFRKTQDIVTPIGELANTDIQTINASAGVGLVKKWGTIGTSVSHYQSDYGIPPDPVAGHPGGVQIDLERNHIETKAEIFPGKTAIRKIELRHAFTRYRHSEIEFSHNLGREITGTGFDVLTHHAAALLRTNRIGIFENGAIGFWGEFRDHSTPSGRNLTPPSKEYSGAAFLYQETGWGKLSLNGALRLDTRSINPQFSGVSNAAGIIRKRSFAGVSGGISGIFHLNSQISLGSSVMRSYRAPGIEELFSEGPHLAVYNYEVGNSNLDAERGLGLEIFVDVKSPGWRLRVAAFRNAISNYIFAKNTGERSIRIYNLFQYQFVGEKALMQGVEGAWEWRPFTAWQIGGTASYVKAELVDLDEAIPRIPPFEGKAYLRFHWQEFSIGAAARAAAKQDRTGEFETPTDGYAIVDLSADYSFAKSGLLHTFSLNIENVFDSEYRKHLNQIKHIFPEPSRNVKLLYKAYF